jgi:hypothetical protein
MMLKGISVGATDHKVCVRLSLAGALVGRHGVLAAEHLQGRVSLDAMLLADVLLDGAVNLGQVDVLLGEGGGSLLVLGG